MTAKGEKFWGVKTWIFRKRGEERKKRRKKREKEEKRKSRRKGKGRQQTWSLISFAVRTRIFIEFPFFWFLFLLSFYRHFVSSFFPFFPKRQRKTSLAMHYWWSLNLIKKRIGLLSFIRFNYLNYLVFQMSHISIMFWHDILIDPLIVVVLAGGTTPGVMRSLQGLHTEGSAFACRFLIRVWVIVLSLYLTAQVDTGRGRGHRPSGLLS